MSDFQTFRIPRGQQTVEASVFARSLKVAATEGLFLDSTVVSSSHVVVGRHKTTVSSDPKMERNLLAEIENLEQRVANLEASIEIVDELSWEEAIEKARAFFANRAGPAYPDELADSLETSVSQAIALCEALEQEGLVATE